jgi:putative OPT family oligopeptide transporter
VLLTVVPGVLGFMDAWYVRAPAAALIGIFAFFFVTVSSRIVGMVGVTSNPTSGMTIATLLGTSLIFAAAGWTDDFGKATALMVGTVVCIAASIAGDTSQDLKTGFVLGATPKFQQIGELVGVVTSAGVVAWTIGYLHQATEGGLGGAELPAPQSVLMKLVVDGVLDANLPWMLILIGAALAAVVSLFKLPVLAFAVGVYLPLSTMAAVFVGGLTRWMLTRKQTVDDAEHRRDQGILLGSGMVGGEGLTGVLLAIWVVAVGGGQRITGVDLGLPDWLNNLLALVAIVCIGWLLSKFAKRRFEDTS